MTRLSVNLNKIALLRNQRDLPWPDIVALARIVLDAGADGITVHPRHDARHIRTEDVRVLADVVAAHPKEVEFNIEGYPDDDFIALVSSVPCHQVTLVPDAPTQNTSDHGWELPAQQDTLAPRITQLRAPRTRGKPPRISLFMDPLAAMMPLAKDCGADRVELYTGPYNDAHMDFIRTGDEPTFMRILDTYRHAVEAARAATLDVNAGHDLTLDNLPHFLRHCPPIAEMSIGHALTADALIMGMATATGAYLACIKQNGG